MEIDDLVIQLLTKAPLATNLRLVTVAMKISQNLERIGDEATKIAKRARDLSQEPPVKINLDLPRMAGMALDMLKAALDAFVNRDSAAARAIVPRDKEVDALNKQIHEALAQHMVANPDTIGRCLQLDGRLQKPRTHRRPRQEHGRGGRLSLRSAGHPAFRGESRRKARSVTPAGAIWHPHRNAAVSAASSSTVPVRESKTRGGTPLSPAGEDAGATTPPPANEYLARVSNGAQLRRTPEILLDARRRSWNCHFVI